MNRENLGFFISAGLLVGIYYVVNTHYSHQQPQPATPAAATAPAQLSPLPSSVATPAVGAAPVSTPASQEIVPVDAGTLTLDTGNRLIKFAQQGGCIQELQLKEFKKEVKKEDPVSLYSKNDNCRAFGVRVGGADLRGALARVHRIDAHTIQLSQSSGNLEIVRTFSFQPETFRGTLAVDVRNLSAVEQRTSVGLEFGAESEAKSSGGFFSGKKMLGHEVEYGVDGSVERVPLKFEEGKRSELLNESSVKPDWVSTGSMYFMSALIPKSKEVVNLQVLRTGNLSAPDAQSEANQTVYEAWMDIPVQLPPNGTKTFSYELFTGPKSRKVLDTFDVAGLSKSINYGFFSIVAWPLFYALSFLERFLGNWGLAIIALTALVKLVLYPLALKSYLATKRMQKLQPQMNELREKYKDDKQKMNQETMALMAREGANPLSGCLPILPQFPIFFGLFNVFQQTFELRHAPFFFWIHDLSVMDPYFVLPIILMVLYFVQQRLTPTPAGMDPAQAKMMQILPFVFAFMMITFPSGLALYMITNTVLSIAQQQYMTFKYKNV